MKFDDHEYITKYCSCHQLNKLISVYYHLKLILCEFYGY